MGAAPPNSALKECDHVIQSIKSKADTGERKARWSVLALVILSGSIPFFIVLSTQYGAFWFGRCIPAALAASATVVSGWMQFERPHERWKLYRGYQRVLEMERLRYRSELGDYDGPDRDDVLVEKLVQYQLRLHDEWAGLLPSLVDLKTLEGKPA